MSKRNVTELEGEEEEGKKDGFQQRCDFLHNAMEKLKPILEEIDSKEVFSPDEWKKLRTSVNNICNEKPPNDFSPVAGIPSAQLLATYCDNILKTRCMDDEDFEDIVDKILSIFAHISDKDTFAEYHRRNLAHRLVNDETENDNRERSVLRKLKQQCGKEFTSKMEAMLTDPQRDAEYHIANPHMEFKVMVMTAERWPSDTLFAKLNPPPEMATCVEKFKEIYKTKWNEKLTWIYSMGTCIMTGYFDSGMKQIIATPCQASALLLFNTEEILSYSDIRSQLNLTDEDTSLLLHTLACGRYKILNKNPDTESVTQTDTFKFNESFTHKWERFSILPTLEQADYKEEIVMKVVDEDRCNH